MSIALSPIHVRSEYNIISKLIFVEQAKMPREILEFYADEAVDYGILVVNLRNLLCRSLVLL
jgi:hypothetical protein